jgi:hypothetical protein
MRPFSIRHSNGSEGLVIDGKQVPGLKPAGNDKAMELDKRRGEKRLKNELSLLNPNDSCHFAFIFPVANLELVAVIRRLFPPVDSYGSFRV